MIKIFQPCDSKRKKNWQDLILDLVKEILLNPSVLENLRKPKTHFYKLNLSYYNGYLSTWKVLSGE